MKSRSEIWLRALEELGAQCSVSTTRDAQTAVSRLKREGESFFTLALPAFGKELERALALDGIPRNLFTGWSRKKEKIKLFLPSGPARVKQVPGAPEFLSGFLDLVFKHETSVGISASFQEELSLDLYPQIRIPANEEEKLVMADAIAAIRQLCLMFSKEKELCSDSLQKEAIAQYLKTDQELDQPLTDARAATLFGGGRLERTRQVVRIMFGNALSLVDQEIFYEQLIPGHGPGATQDSLYGNQKWTLPTWHDRLETLFPFGVYGIPGYSFAWKYAAVKHLAPEEEPPVKVWLVPKTQRSPRLIAIEPTVMQYIQQAISRRLVQQLERDALAHWFVGFSHQWPNNFMAQIGSEDGSLATLDLSEASDRVAAWHVEDLFQDFPHFLEGIDACRSTRAQLPSGDVITLQKFASMGSAMTFPLEAMIFTAIVVERVLNSIGQPISRGSILALRDRVRVYGDDIICPTDTAESVIDGLEVFGFKVNRAKSFWTGRFRESCGKEYWYGLDVSIVKFREKLPTSLHDAKEIVSTVSTRNQLYKAGLKKTAYLLDSVIGSCLRGKYPIVAENSPVLGRLDDTIRYEVHGFDEALQAPFVRGYTVSPKSPVNAIGEDDALLKCLLTNSGGHAKIAEDHLTRSGRPRAVSIKLGKASPF